MLDFVVTRRVAFFVLAFTAAMVGQARAEVSLGRLFTDNMMLQRNQPVRFWGKAAPGETVTVTLAGKSQQTKADDRGGWLVELPPIAEGENLEVTIAGKNTLVLENVIVGDIWLCSGQSNMEWNLNACDGAEDAKEADFPKIRRIKFHHVTAATGADEAPATGPWQVCSPKTAGDFTGAGFYFARDVHTKTGVPIGILDDNWGGTKIEPWIVPGGLDAVPELAKETESRRQAIEHWRKHLLPTYFNELERWLPKARADLAAGETPAPAPAVPAHPGASGWCSIANAMIYPLVKFPIKGVIWYQGESNGNEGQTYLHKKQALITGWRKVWNQPDMPFYFVQLASYQQATDDPAGGNGWANLREAQRHALVIPHTGMAVAIDTVPLAVAGDIHPKNKFDLGLRLARWALHHDYGQKNLVPSGPLFKSFKVEGGKIRIEFDHVGTGLMVGLKDGTRKPVVENAGGKLERFAVAGADKKWFWANAVIDGKTVVVSAPEVMEPVAVRYAFSMNPSGANLYNHEGLPASPFRTDDW